MTVGGEAIKIAYRFGGMGRYGETIFVLYNQRYMVLI